MSWLEIFREVASKGLRAVNEEINASAPKMPVVHDQPDLSNVYPLRHTREGYEQFHPAFYDTPKNDRGVA
jgi:acetone carboxylase gamma subunit